MKKTLLKSATAAVVLLQAGVADANLTVSFFNGITNSTLSNSSVAGVPIGRSDSFTTADGRAVVGSVSADYGILKSFTTATGTNFGQASAETRATWLDEITITTPGNSSGFITTRMAFDKQFSFGANGFSFNIFDIQFIATRNSGGDRYFYQYNLNSSFTSQLSATLFINNNGATSVATLSSLPDGPVTVDFPIPFNSGESFTISSNLGCSARGNLTTAVCDAGNSAYWGGIRSVTDSNGSLERFSIILAHIRTI